MVSDRCGSFSRALVTGVLVSASLCGCGETPSITDPATAWPRTIAGLDIDHLGLGDDAHGEGLAYDVGHALWVGGADKHRVLALAAGDAIDDRDRTQWRFPAGTVAFKTLVKGGRPIETRAIRALDDDAWEYVAYRWNDAGTDAEQLALDDATAIALPSGATHEVPSQLQCRQCHESAAVPLLGLTELQLADAVHGDESELERFDRAGLLRAGVPAEPRRVAHDDAATAAVLGWFVGNCLHCHNGGDGENASFDLDPRVALGNIIDRATQSSASADGTRIVPGDPEASLLFLAVSGDHDDAEIDAMPPVANDVRDDTAIAVLRSWIEGLAP